MDFVGKMLWEWGEAGEGRGEGEKGGGAMGLD